jgi:hypothetical protein
MVAPLKRGVRRIHKSPLSGNPTESFDEGQNIIIVQHGGARGERLGSRLPDFLRAASGKGCHNFGPIGNAGRVRYIGFRNLIPRPRFFGLSHLGGFQTGELFSASALPLGRRHRPLANWRPTGGHPVPFRSLTPGPPPFSGMNSTPAVAAHGGCSPLSIDSSTSHLP